MIAYHVRRGLAVRVTVTIQPLAGRNMSTICSKKLISANARGRSCQKQIQMQTKPMSKTVKQNNFPSFTLRTQIV